MFVNNVVVNGVALKVAFVRFDENGLSVEGMTPSGTTEKLQVPFCDGMTLTVEIAQPVPVKKERKPRKAKAQPEVVENAPVVEMATDAEYAEYLTQNRRGRPSKKIVAYKAAHNL